MQGVETRSRNFKAGEVAVIAFADAIESMALIVTAPAVIVSHGAHANRHTGPQGRRDLGSGREQLADDGER
jgi:hypothetical protein